MSPWFTQELAEFVAAVSVAGSEAAAARASVERAAEALDADVAAIVRGGEVVAAVGYPQGRVPVAELARVHTGAGVARLVVPGVGECLAAAATLEYPTGAVLLVARPDALTREESGQLRAMARVASTTMRLWSVLADERAAREELQRLAREQAALRQVATLVARGERPAGVLAAVAEEVGRLFAAETTSLVRFDADGAETWVGSWDATGLPMRADRRRPATDVPITVEGRLWGALRVANPPRTAAATRADERLAGFAELVATAIANAETRAELTASRARIVATADETRRRIERDLHDGAQQRLVTFGLRLQALRATVPAELGELATELDVLAAELVNALDELREFARGIHPALLNESGLGPALRTLIRRCPIPVRSDVRVSGRLREPVEVAAYYVVSEALANAAKHANATSVAVDVETTEERLRLSVRDDGVGGADVAGGSGLVGLKDRVEAIGGRIVVESRRGAGTSVRAELPLADGTTGVD
ncbi:ATP-binding protein [Jiangella endophytica]|uniref:ATP-binding protein n=1 Tax=Jiangella endophytica TaxID=1623398 RepID=UPI0013001BAD|nr:ATP-binding protein [Jiangella endophytica]